MIPSQFGIFRPALALTALVVCVFPGAPVLRGQALDADNVRDFDENSNALAPGRWACGWIVNGNIEDPNVPLSLFQSKYPNDRVSAPNWAADGTKPEIAWMLTADGNAYADHSDLVWIYQVPAGLAGRIRITGNANSQAGTKRLRVYLAKDEFFSGQDREKMPALFDETGMDLALDLTVEAAEGELLLFIQDDATEEEDPPYWVPQTLHVNLSKSN